MTTNTTYLDEFIDKMYLVPNDINRHLRLIRTLDKKAEAVQQSLNQIQGRFLNQLKEYKQSQNGSMNGSSTSKKQSSSQMNEVPTSLKNQYERIVSKQKQIYGYYKQKYDVSQQLRVMVNDFYQQLDGQLKNKLKEKTQEEKVMFDNRRKAASKFLSGTVVPALGTQGANLGGKLSNSILNNSLFTQNPLNSNNQFMYDSKQPTYCYCGRASFGEMVMCENPYCQREWFHLDCIEEKNLPQKWYCLECQKQKDKTRNNVSRGFFVNRDNESK